MSFVARTIRKHARIVGALTNVWTLFAMLLVTSIVTLLLFLASLSRPHITEAPYELASVPQAELETARSAGRQVRVGLSIRDFLTFDMTNNDFVFEGVVWFDLGSAGADSSTLGKFSFERGQVLERSTPERRGSRVLYWVKVRVQSDLWYRSFPLDDHRLDIVLRNRAITVSDAVWTSSRDALVLSPTAVDESWRLLGATARAGASSTRLDGAAAVVTPEVLFSLSFKHAGLRRLFIIFVPLFFIFFLGLSSLTLDPTHDFGAVLSLSVGSLTALLFYALVIDAIAPRVDYFTVADDIYTLLLIIGTMTFCLHVVLLHHHTKWVGKTALPDVLQFVHTAGGVVRGLAFIMSLATMLLCVLLILP